MNQYQLAYYNSPIGILEIKGTVTGILSINFKDDSTLIEKTIPEELEECVKQLDEYFNGTRKEFSISVFPKGSNFQKKVWNELLKIPYGKTVSYKTIAKVMGDEKLTRAIGNANGKNPISIIIPCHRVIGNNGKLIGYGGGLWRKEWLLNHEKKIRNLDEFFIKEE